MSLQPLASRPWARSSWIPGVACVLLSIVVLLVAAEAEARPRRGSSAAAAAARKRQMIAALQRQLAAAKQVLAAAESQAQLSQTEVNAAVSKLSDIRTTIDVDEDDARDASKTLHELESEILSEQSFSSEFKQTQQNLVIAKEALHELLHKRFPGLPQHVVEVSDETGRLADLAAISADARKSLADDGDYQATLGRVQSLAKKLAQIRQALFDAEPEWVEARKEAAEAARKVREAKAEASTTGIGSLDDRRNLRTAQSVAAYARTLIGQFESRLAALGAKPAPPPKKSQSGR